MEELTEETKGLFEKKTPTNAKTILQLKTTTNAQESGQSSVKLFVYPLPTSISIHQTETSELPHFMAITKGKFYETSKHY